MLVDAYLGNTCPLETLRMSLEFRVGGGLSLYHGPRRRRPSRSVQLGHKAGNIALLDFGHVFLLLVRQRVRISSFVWPAPAGKFGHGRAHHYRTAGTDQTEDDECPMAHPHCGVREALANNERIRR